MITMKFADKAPSTGALIIPMFEGKIEKPVLEMDKRFSGCIQNIIDLEDFTAKKKTTALLMTGDADIPRLILVGLGKKKDLDIKTYKEAIGKAIILAQGKKQDNVALLLTDKLFGAIDATVLGQETAIATELATYAYDELKQQDAQAVQITSATFVAEKKLHVALKKSVAIGQLIAEGANFTRTLGNTPPSVMTPARLAKDIEKSLKDAPNTTVEILDKAAIKKLGMGCLLGVSQGSELPPKFIIVEYRGGKKTEKPTVLVGKGITYDSGGLSLKPSAYMSDMKFDMLGAATVAGIMKAVTSLKIKKNIVALIPSCENMPSGSSYRPDDILINMNGKSVLVDNTDAEGRLILSDALSYAHRYEPKEVIDFATLTGACVVAIGENRSGLFTPVNKIETGIMKAAEKTGEWLWPLPLGDDFAEQLKSPIADIKNISASRYGGASTAAEFLRFWTKNEDGDAYPWAHIDLSSSYFKAKGPGHMRGGANGACVQTMVEYLR